MANNIFNKQNKQIKTDYSAHTKVFRDTSASPNPVFLINRNTQLIIEREETIIQKTKGCSTVTDEIMSTTVTVLHDRINV